MSEFQFPRDLRYTAEHEWIRADGGNARIGITAFAQDALGDVIYVTLPEVGDSVSAGDSCGEIESTKSVTEIYAPLDGEVLAVNDQLEGSPELVNSDPYGEGWMIEFKVAATSQLDALLDAAAYEQQLD